MRSAHLPPPPTHTQRVTGPSIAVSHTRLDLGEGRPGEQLEGSFTVSNRGSEPLEFKLSASCGCAFVRPMAGTLAPGESQRITLGIRLPQAINSEKSTRVAIQSNDPRQPQVICAATARAPAPWEVSQTCIDFGYLLRRELDKPPTQRLVVRPGKGTNALPTSVVQVRAASQAYTVRTRRRRDGTLVVEVSLCPGLADGRYNSTLELGAGDEALTMSIPLVARIGPGISVIPERVRLRARAEGGYEPAGVHVVSHQPGVQLGPLRICRCPAGVEVEERAVAASLRRVTIRVSAEMSIPSGGLEIDLDAGESGGRLNVRLLPPEEAGADHRGRLPTQGESADLEHAGVGSDGASGTDSEPH
jgi:hypothetical protein